MPGSDSGNICREPKCWSPARTGQVQVDGEHLQVTQHFFFGLA